MDPATALSTLPKGLRRALLDSLDNIVRNYRERRWEPSELNGGKLCEVVYTILKGHVDGKMPASPKKPRNMVDACKGLEGAAAAKFPRAVRIQVPRMLVALYEIRNGRGVSHVGSEVDPNPMDARAVLEMSKWVTADLVRIFHDLSVEEATAVVDGLVERTTPIVWKVEDKRRVLDTTLSMKDQTLLLLYSENGPVCESDLVSWVEHSNASVYRRDVLQRAHRQRLIEYNKASGTAQLSPTGIAYVEDNLPLEV